MPRSYENRRADRRGTHETQFRKNQQIIYKTQEICGICGRPVDQSLKFPDPMSRCIDHIVPISRGGHPSAMSNLQLAHLVCNRAKSDRLAGNKSMKAQEQPNNRNLPQSRDWRHYKIEREIE